MTGGAPRRAPASVPSVGAAAGAADAAPTLVLDPTPVVFPLLVGATSVEWEVVEVDAAAVPGARGPRCLLFSRPDCIRRVWHYPPDWRTLGAVGLAALSWGR
jgi:hypothetical protein